MANGNRRNIELYRSCLRLLDQVASCADLVDLALHRELARELRVVAAALVAHLQRSDGARALSVVERLFCDLDLAMRLVGVRPPLTSAYETLEVVRQRLWFPAEIDGPPVINREPPDFETQGLPEVRA